MQDQTRAGRNARRFSSPQGASAAAGFTLVELLVVIAIVVVLATLLMPTLRGVRAQAQLAQCQSNLRTIGAAALAYAADNGQRLPTRDMMGRMNFRLPPGARNDYDPFAMRETYGLPAVLHGVHPFSPMPAEATLPRFRYIDGTSEVWVCPSQTERMKGYGVTYSASIARALDRHLGAVNGKSVLAWDNYINLPAPSGFSGPFSGFTIPSDQRVLAHRGLKRGKGAVCELQVGGYVDVRIVD